MKKYYILILMAFTMSYLFSISPVVTDVEAIPGSGQVVITYNLEADSACQITVLASANGGASYDIYPTALTGQVGNSVSAGRNEIIWRPASDGMDVGLTYKVKIIARDNPVNTEEQFESFIKIPGGTFTMGNTLGLDESFFSQYTDLPTTHQVTLSPFYMSKYEVTQAEYEAVMGNNPSKFTENGINKPVDSVSWSMAVTYCNTRSIQEGLTPCYDLSDWSCDFSANGYRLPTEAEWEYAARGASNNPDYYYSGSNTLDDVAWHWGNSGNITHNVGEKAANSLGIHDMSGNVWEWCYDWSGPQTDEAQTNPTGPATSAKRSSRGGSFLGEEGTVDFWLVAFRNSGEQDGIYENSGFRLVRSNIEIEAPQVVADPIITPAGGTYGEAQTISIACETADASIYYTLDGSDPDETDNLYLEAFGLSTTKTVKARAYKDGWEASEVVSQVYEINIQSEDFVFVEGGTYDQGTVGDFYICTHEVTQAEYQALMGSNPSYFSGSNKPVETVTWVDAINYCNARSIAEGLTPCYDMSNWSCDFSANGYRLPTQLEWTYAAKGGNLTSADVYASNSNPDGYRWAGTNVESELTNYAWYGGNNSPRGTKEVATKLPNELGIYDMSGNVHEWTNQYRYGWCLFIGGAWGHNSLATIYGGIRQTNTCKANDIGFRLVRNIVVD